MNAKSPDDKDLVSVLLELEDQTLIDLLNWLYDMESIERTKISTQLSQLSFDKLVRLAQLTPENRKMLFNLFKAQPSEKFSDKAHSKIEKIDEKWGKGLERWEKWLEEKKKERGK